MKTSYLVVALIVLAGSACEEEPPPPIVRHTIAVREEPPPPPPEYKFRAEENALASLMAMHHIPAVASFVAATSNPTALFELLGGEDPKPTELDALHAPEVLDLHPTRLTAAGLDPNKPVGIAILSLEDVNKGAIWAVFGTLANEDDFVKAFDLHKRDKNGRFAPRDKEDPRAFLVLDNGEVIIASRENLFDPEVDTLADNVEFQDLTTALDYGKLGTVFVRTRRGAGIYGVGFEDEGLAVKVFAPDETYASALRLDFAEYFASTDVTTVDKLVHADPQSDMNPQRKGLRAKLESLERAPQKRRLTEAKLLTSRLEELGSLDARKDSLFIAGRAWQAKREDVPAAFEKFLKLGRTEDEERRMDELRESFRALTMSNNQDVEKMTEQLVNGSAGLGAGLGKFGGLAENFSKMGGGLVGKSGKGGKGGKGGGMMDNLGGLGGMLGGVGGVGGLGGSSDDQTPDVSVDAEDPRVEKYAKRRLGRVVVCYAQYGGSERVTIKADLTIDEAGTVTINELKGASGKLGSCVHKALTTSAGKGDLVENGIATFRFRP